MGGWHSSVDDDAIREKPILDSHTWKLGNSWMSFSQMHAEQSSHVHDSWGIYLVSIIQCISDAAITQRGFIMRAQTPEYAPCPLQV